MGIDFAVAQQLIHYKDLVSNRANGVMLGRQGLHIKPRYFSRLKKCLADASLPSDLDMYIQEDGYSEAFLKGIGFPVMETIDASGYEGAMYCHDLNIPIVDKLRGRFGVVLDGGTLEHVFNAPQALDNVFHMLDEGGVFVSINGMTGWAGHGFYQFSPELVWRYWKDSRECEVVDCLAVPLDPRIALRRAVDRGKRGSRFRGKGMNGRWYLFYVIRKTEYSNRAERITYTSQGDYQRLWKDHLV